VRVLNHREEQNLESSLPSDVLPVDYNYRIRPGDVACGERPEGFRDALQILLPKSRAKI